MSTTRVVNVRHAWMGCTKVSPACASCYAQRDRAVAAASQRVGLPLWGPNAARVVTSDAYWKQPLRWEVTHAR